MKSFRRPLSRRIQAWMMRGVNVPVRILLRLPIAPPVTRRLMLASFTGRKTGRRYRQPLSYVRDGDVLLTPGGGRWKQNLREGDPVRLRLRGRDVDARPELVGDAAGVARLLEVIAAANPTAERFVGVRRGPDGRFDRAALENAVRHGFRIVRWHLDAGHAESDGR